MKQKIYTKKNIDYHQNLTGSSEKVLRHLMNFKICRTSNDNQTVKGYMNCGKNYAICQSTLGSILKLGLFERKRSVEK